MLEYVMMQACQPNSFIDIYYMRSLLSLITLVCTAYTLFELLYSLHEDAYLIFKNYSQLVLGRAFKSAHNFSFIQFSKKQKN